MLLTFVDVVARYLLNRPIRGGFEVTELAAAGADLRRPAAGVARRRARHHGLHRPHAAGRAGARSVDPRRCTRSAPRSCSSSPGRCGSRPARSPATATPPTCCASPIGPFVYFMAAMIALTGLVHVFKIFVPGSRARQPGDHLTHMTEALIGLGCMLVLAFLRLPIALAMGVVGIVGYAYMRDWNWARRLRHRADQDLRDRAQLHAVGGAAVHPDGQLRHARRHVAGAVPHRLRLHRPPARRPGDGHHRRLRRLRRDLRLVDRHRGDLRQGRVPVDEEVRLLRRARHRRDRRRRHARHPDPALHHHGDLRDHDRDQHRQAVRRRHPARASSPPCCSASRCSTSPGATRRPARAASACRWKERFATLHGVGWFAAVGVAVVGSASFGWLRVGRRRGARRARGVRPVAHLQGRDQRDRALRPGDGRHLRRRVHRGRGRRRRRVRRAWSSRSRAASLDLARALRGAGRERAHHRDAVHDPDRRADVRRVRQHHLDARRPEELRHRAAA